MSRFPAVGLIGPRQAGKTTLAQAIAGELGERADVKPTRRFVVYPGKERYRIDPSTEVVPLPDIVKDGFERLMPRGA